MIQSAEYLNGRGNLPRQLVDTCIITQKISTVCKMKNTWIQSPCLKEKYRSDLAKRLVLLALAAASSRDLKCLLQPPPKKYGTDEDLPARMNQRGGWLESDDVEEWNRAPCCCGRAGHSFKWSKRT